MSLHSTANQHAPSEKEAGSPFHRERRLIEVSLDPLIALTAEGRIIDVNEAMVRVTGVPREELLGNDFARYFERPEPVRSLCREALSRGAVTDFNLEVRHRDGALTALVCSANAYLDPQADAGEVFLSGRDVTGQRRAERGLWQAEQKFTEAQRLAQVGYWEQECDGGNAVWSREACRIFGLSPKEQGVPWHQLTELMHPEDRARAMRMIHEALQGGPRYDIEFRVVRPDGEERFVHSQSDVVMDDAGNPIRIFGTVQDITELKRTEDELRRTNARIFEFLESITDRFAVFDRDWRYIYVNEKQAWFLRLPREQVLGRCLWDVYPELVGTPAEEKLKQAMTERVSVSYDFLLPAQKRWLGVHAYPAKEGVAIYSRDITESKHEEEKLRNSQARYRALYRENPVMLFTLDPQGTVLAVNPAGLNQLDYTLAELKGQSVLNVFHPDDRDDFAEQLQACLRNPDHVQHWQCRKIRKDGVVLWVDELAQPIRDLDGAVNVLVVCQDVTERQRAEEEIRKMNSTLEERVRNRTEEFEESEKRFRNIYDTAPVSIWQQDWTEVRALVDGLRVEGVTDFETYFREHPEFVERALKAVKILDVNQWTLDMFAAGTKEQMLASLDAVFATPETLRGFVAHLSAFARGAPTYRSESALNTLKGETILCFIAMTFPPPGGGNVLATVIDITERKRAEEALRQSEENSRLLFDTTLQGVVFQDSDGRILSMNPAAVRILGRMPDEMEWCCTSADNDHPTLREDGSPLPKSEHLALVSLATGREVRGVVGVYNPSEQAYRWIDIRAVPLVREGTKNPQQFYTIFDDITERSRSERQIRRQTAILTGINRIFRETLPHVNDDEVAAIFLQVIRDLTSSPIGFAEETETPDNPTRITLERSLQANGDLGRADALALLRSSACTALREMPRTSLSQIINRRSPSEPGPGAITRFLSVPFLETGNVAGFIGLANKLTDYTEEDRQAVEAIAPALVEVLKRKRSEQTVTGLNDELARRALALERANKELESFTYSAAHDLRAPLRNLAGFSRALIEGYEDRLDDMGKDYLHRIHRASERMAHLIDDMLHLAQVSRSELHRTPVNLSALASMVADGLRLADTNREVEFVIAPDLVASGDAHMLQIVLENLLGNAWKFSRARPVARIEFGRTPHTDQPTYFVRDNGVGFDMQFVHKLFGAFQRLQSEFPGTGIGLATVQRIIHRHGGSVCADGQPGQGATFYFTLP